MSSLPSSSAAAPVPSDPRRRVDPRAVMLVLGMSACFAVLETTAKWLSHHYPVPMVVWVRYVVHVGLMLVLFAPKRGLRLFRTVQPAGQISRATLMLGSTACNFGAVAFLPLAEVKAITFVSPLLVSIFAVWLLHERVSLRVWIAILVGFAGTLFIVRPGSSMLNPAVLLALGSALCYSLYQILTRKVSSGGDDPVTSLFYTAAVGAVMMTCLVPHSWIAPDPAHLPQFLLLGAAGMTGHFLLIKALEIEQASSLSPFGYTQLLWIGATGWFVFGDFPDAHSLIGMGVIVGSGLYVAFGQRGRTPAEEPESAIE